MTVTLGLLRHGITSWNQAGRLQGRADIGLSPEGRATLEGRRLPAPFASAPVYCSPLARAQESAAALGLTPLRLEPRLIEMDWGDFEGLSLESLRANEGETLRLSEEKGLDFTPPGGESPRMVQARLKPWLAELSRAKEPLALAITHKGVMRALLGLAYNWDFTGKPPFRVDWEMLQVLELDQAGELRPQRLNLALEDRSCAPG